MSSVRSSTAGRRSPIHRACPSTARLCRSITDGQIYLSPDLFRKGVLPAVDVGKSVSRVGGKTQVPAYRAVVGDLRLAHAQFEELETFARFATRLDEDTRASIEHGRRVREVLKQAEQAPLPVAEQVAVMRALNAGLFDELALEEVAAAEQALREAVREGMGSSMSTCSTTAIFPPAAISRWDRSCSR
jgi:F-type H+-transporting ATPase subunit alpha